MSINGIRNIENEPQTVIKQKFELNGSVRPADRLINVKLNNDSDFLIIENSFWTIYNQICSIAVSKVS